MSGLAILHLTSTEGMPAHPRWEGQHRSDAHAYDALSPHTKERKAMRILSPKEAIRMVGLSRVTVWKMETHGDFPRAIRLSKGRKGYMEDEIEAWIESRKAERNEGAQI